MAARKPGLGRGLSALLDDVKDPDRAAVATLPIAQIRANPAQPRRRFDSDALDELTASVRERGVLQPILVRPVGEDAYEVVAGERRWRAAQAAGLHDIPALVRELDDGATLEIAIVENVQRADLSPIEEAEGYRRLIQDFGHTQDEVGRIVGKSRSHVANLVRLLELPEPIRLAVGDGRLSVGHAKALMVAKSPESLAQTVIAQGLSVRDTEARANRTTEEPRAGLGPVAKRAAAMRLVTAKTDPDIAALEHQLEASTGLKVRIVYDPDAGGRVEIAFRTMDQFDQVVDKLQR